jgi:hypothetical protein
MSAQRHGETLADGRRVEPNAVALPPPIVVVRTQGRGRGRFPRAPSKPWQSGLGLKELAKGWRRELHGVERWLSRSLGLLAVHEGEAAARGKKNPQDKAARRDVVVLQHAQQMVGASRNLAAAVQVELVAGGSVDAGAAGSAGDTAGQYSAALAKLMGKVALEPLIAVRLATMASAMERAGLLLPPPPPPPPPVRLSVSATAFVPLGAMGAAASDPVLPLPPSPPLLPPPAVTASQTMPAAGGGAVAAEPAAAIATATATKSAAQKAAKEVAAPHTITWTVEGGGGVAAAVGELRVALLPRSALDTCKLSRKEVEALAQPIRHFGVENVRAALGCATSTTAFGGNGKERQSAFFDLLLQQNQSPESARFVGIFRKALWKSHEPQHKHPGWESRKHNTMGAPGGRLTVGDEVRLRKRPNDVGIIVRDDHTARPYLVVGRGMQSDEWRAPGDVKCVFRPKRTAAERVADRAIYDTAAAARRAAKAKDEESVFDAAGARGGAGASAEGAAAAEPELHECVPSARSSLRADMQRRPGQSRASLTKGKMQHGDE